MTANARMAQCDAATCTATKTTRRRDLLVQDDTMSMRAANRSTLLRLAAPSTSSVAVAVSSPTDGSGTIQDSSLEQREKSLLQADEAKATAVANRHSFPSSVDSPSSLSSLQTLPSPTDLPRDEPTDEERDETCRRAAPLSRSTSTKHHDLLTDALSDQSTISNTSLHDDDEYDAVHLNEENDNVWSSSASASRDDDSDDSSVESFSCIGIQAWPGSGSGSDGSESDPFENMLMGGANLSGAGSLFPFLGATTALPTSSKAEGAIGSAEAACSDPEYSYNGPSLQTSWPFHFGSCSDVAAHLSTILEEDQSLLDSVYASILHGSAESEDSIVRTTTLLAAEGYLHATMPAGSSFDQSIRSPPLFDVDDDVSEPMLSPVAAEPRSSYASALPVASSSTCHKPDSIQSALDCIAALAFQSE